MDRAFEWRQALQSGIVNQGAWNLRQSAPDSPGVHLCLPDSQRPGSDRVADKEWLSVGPTESITRLQATLD